MIGALREDCTYIWPKRSWWRVHTWHECDYPGTEVYPGARCILGRICILGLEVLGVSPRPNMYPGTNGKEMYPVTRCILQLRSIARPRCIPKDVTLWSCISNLSCQNRTQVVCWRVDVARNDRAEDVNELAKTHRTCDKISPFWQDVTKRGFFTLYRPYRCIEWHFGM